MEEEDSKVDLGDQEVEEYLGAEGEGSQRRGNAITANYRDITAQNLQSATSAKSLGTRPMTIQRRRRDPRNYKTIGERSERVTAWKARKTTMWSQWRRGIEVR